MKNQLNEAELREVVAEKKKVEINASNNIHSGRFFQIGLFGLIFFLDKYLV